MDILEFIARSVVSLIFLIVGFAMGAYEPKNK